MSDERMVRGKCPACGWSCLFLGNGGYVTCSISDCPDPSAAHKLLDAAPASDPRFAQIRDLAQAARDGSDSKQGYSALLNIECIASAAAAGERGDDV